MYGRNSYLGEGICTHGREMKTCEVCNAPALSNGKRRTISQEQFQSIYAAVKDRLSDLINWRPEDVARVTVEETLALLYSPAAPPAESATPAPKKQKWIVVCDDPEHQILFFEGYGAEEAARKAHHEMCQNWTCELFLSAADLPPAESAKGEKE